MSIEKATAEALAKLGARPDAATDQELLRALTVVVRDRQLDGAPAAGERKLYYFSAEFLVGRLLRANLINLGLIDEVEDMLRSAGTSLARVEDHELEPSLGNGGLGRLAACFLDSIASLGLSGDGVGLNYHFGLFRQDLSDGVQRELPEPWIEPESWLIDTGMSFPVDFGSCSVRAHLYDIEVPGYENGVVNRLHLFDVEHPAGPPARGIDFDKTDIAGNLTSFLYPDDSDEAGRLLRLHQEYFLASAGAQLIIAELAAAGRSLTELDRHVVIHINDTHPSMVIPELVRLLAERGIGQGEAIDIVSRSCAYTNHTILAEALETWPVGDLEQVAPQIVPCIRGLDQRARRASADPAVAIWDDRDVIHMAHMDVHCCRKVNGVAALHTKILESSEMRAFARLYPGKFTNETNGISFRRWLMGCDPMLAECITAAIGPAWKRDATRLTDLLGLVDDEAFRDELLDIKQVNKLALAFWLRDIQKIELDSQSVFDIQIKRMHQYKRQQMNALYAIWKYLQIKAGKVPERPLTMLFAGKAAPAYTLAKDTIHLLMCLGRLIESDREVSAWLHLVMVENYNVAAAEHLVPACDISEQISLASKEASGTGNMKLMANGAITLGTLDGANVEIADLVGPQNIYLFGRSSQDVIDAYGAGTYRPCDYWQKPWIGELIDFIVSPEMLRLGDAASLSRLYKDFIAKDYFMALLDIEDYISVKESCLSDFEHRGAWGRKMLVNIARSGFFSSDRAIAEYDRDIWHLSS